MSSLVIWMLGIALSAAALVLAAAQNMFYVHMCIAALISILVALASFSEVRTAENTPAGDRRGIDISLRHMGLIWAWGAIALFVTYAFNILSWREWWQFFIVFALLAGLSLFLAATLRKDAEGGNHDDMLIKVARGFSIFILGAMLITMAGLLIDGKMWRFTTIAGLRRGSQDWAGNNIFFFGALALAAISWNAVKITGQKLKAAA